MFFRILMLATLLVPSFAMASASPDEFMAMTAERQKEMLQVVGYQEGGDVGDFDAMKAYAEMLHKKYEGVNLGTIHKDELLLLTELTKTDHIISYFSQDKDVMLQGCQMGVELAKYLPPSEAFAMHTGCNYKTKGLTAVESEKVKSLVVSKNETISERAAEANDPRKNFYLANSGWYLCSASIDCAEGSKRMYEAILNEYIEKGVEKYEPEVLENTIGMLQNYLGRTKNILLLTATYELQYKLFKAGVIQQDKSDLANLADVYRAEMTPGDKQVEEIIAILDSGKSILDMEAERYRREKDLKESAKQLAAQTKVSREPAKAEQSKSVAAENQSESGNNNLWLPLAGGVVLLLGLFGFYMSRRKKG